MQLLLLSNSTNAGEPYLQWAEPVIRGFLANRTLNAVFIPFAAVTFSYDEYEQKVREKLENETLRIQSIHRFANPVQAIEQAELIIVGGGNTFRLVHQLYEQKLMQPIRAKVLNGTPYIGWSAGSNIACPTLRTTNDMPVVEPESFATLGLIPFQINPHYLDANPENHAGETREQRIEEFIALNPTVTVAGLREATALLLDGSHLNLLGNRPLRVFKYGQEPAEYEPGSSLSFLL